MHRVSIYVYTYIGMYICTYRYICIYLCVCIYNTHTHTEGHWNTIFGHITPWLYRGFVEKLNQFSTYGIFGLRSVYWDIPLRFVEDLYIKFAHRTIYEYIYNLYI